MENPTVALSAGHGSFTRPADNAEITNKVSPVALLFGRLPIDFLPSICYNKQL